jgi:hypothetical protein
MDDIEQEAAREVMRNRRKCNDSIMTTAATGLSGEFYYVKEAVCQFIILYHVYRMTREANGGQGYTDEDWSMTLKAMKRATNNLKSILCLETDSHVSIPDLLFIQTLRYEMLFSFCPPLRIGGFYELTRDKYISYLDEHGDNWFI